MTTLRAIQDRHASIAAWLGRGLDLWLDACKRFIGEVSRGFDADRKRIRPRANGRTKTEVRDKFK
jgi:hypothetical protein